MKFTLTKPFTKNGVFFLPGDETSYNGNLLYDPTKGLFLQLKDLPLDYREDSFVQMMSGRLYGDPYSCTLINVRYEMSNFSGNRDGVSRITTFFVNALLLGKQISDPNELLFDQVDFTYSNFRNWINEPSIFIDYTREDKIATIKKLPEITGNLDELFDFEIKFGNIGSYPSKSFEISITQNVTFNIISKNKKPLSINEYINMNKIIKCFFMFMQGVYVTEESIFCRNKSKDIDVELIQFYQRFAEPKKLEIRDFRHTYASIAMKFERILKNWIKKYKEMPDFFNSFFENVINENLFTYDKFENLYQSLLFYYNYKFDDARMPKEDYKLFIKEMKNKLNDKEQQFIERFVGSGNVFSLSQQLEKIFMQLDFWKDKPSECRHYVREIVLVRNRIEHSTESITTKTLSDANNMTHNLTSFISTLILYEIEYSDETTS